MKIDLRPLAIDISLCTNILCNNKCKRYQDNWKPNKNWQSYISPVMEFDKNGNQKECKVKLQSNKQSQ